METSEAVRQLLPLWVQYGAALWVPFAFCVGFGATALGARAAALGVRAADGEHWSARARSSYPARYVAGFLPLLAASMSAITLSELGPLVSLPTGVLAALVSAAAFAGAVLAAQPLVPPALRRSAVRQMGAMLVQVTAFWAPFVAVVALVFLLEPTLEPGNLLVGVVGVAAAIALMFWGGLPLLRLLGVLRPGSEKLQRAVEQAAACAGAVPPRVFQLDVPMANAFALPVAGWVVFTDVCVAALDESQLQAVAAHELAHLAEPRSALYARVATVLLLLPVAFIRVLIELLGTGAALAAVGAPYLLVLLVGRRWMARLEMKADRAAHDHEHEPGVHATALERLYEVNLSPAVVAGRMQTHPSLYDRMLAAGLTPSWPRPAPPSRARTWAGALTAMFILIGGLVAPLLILSLESVIPDDTQHALVRIGVFGGAAHDVFALARAAESDGNLAGALLELELAVELAPRNHNYRAFRAELLARTGQCERARSDYDAADQDASPDHRGECARLDDADFAILEHCAVPDEPEPGAEPESLDG